MALTPEDVVNKRFQPTKFREGYDQDEVDDFLDEVVVELRRLNQENEELRQRLIASDSRINELQRSAGQNGSAPSFSAPAESAQEQAEPVQEQAAPEPVAAPEPFVAPAPQYAAPTAYAAPAPVTDPAVDPNNTNNLLQLARRLHEEHVREGVEKRDALIAEGQEQATRLVQEATAAQQAAAQEAAAAQQAAAQEAEAAQRAKLSTIEAERQQLEAERQQLENRVEELRNFEREYRLKLKSYIEGQLRELDSNNVIGSTEAPTSTPPASPYAAQSAAQPAAGANYTGFGGNN
ncbi:DivIVA domain-containing protein [Conyzicola lurida]|uniref:Cell wall synthesis protein Wag31 n=1 Tax=Conyzicola lurida TaxID=1172621 RepID=A0A841AN44_9MICO|nr:DivIVA domain-containing protein [Conyzicola lurida]MBB5842955.1 DivIVA domain-containing protein [Conyzicola lurida]